MFILSKENFEQFNYWDDSPANGLDIALIDKPKGWTSFDVVAKLRNIFRAKKVGHTGTLDPFATGLLIILFNKATKMQSEFQNLDKTYTATIKLGYTTKTFDGTSEEENPKSIAHLNSDVIIEVVSKFIGEYEQIPPMFSAKKLQGRKLYNLARKNIELELKPNKVAIYNITVEKISLPFVTFEVKCSKGTYIRSLANDIGKALGTGAYLSELRRTRIGNFSVENSLQIQELVDINNVKKVKNENL